MNGKVYSCLAVILRMSLEVSKQQLLVSDQHLVSRYNINTNKYPLSLQFPKKLGKKIIVKYWSANGTMQKCMYCWRRFIWMVHTIVILFMDSKVRTTLHVSIIDSGNEKFSGQLWVPHVQLFFRSRMRHKDIAAYQQAFYYISLQMCWYMYSSMLMTFFSLLIPEYAEEWSPNWESFAKGDSHFFLVCATVHLYNIVVCRLHIYWFKFLMSPVLTCS